MYSKCVQPKLILIGQIVKLVENGQWPTVILYSACIHRCAYLVLYTHTFYTHVRTYIHTFCIYASDKCIQTTIEIVFCIFLCYYSSYQPVIELD